MRCAMAGNGGRRRRAHGAWGCATEAVISASPGILSAESEFHYRPAAGYYRILFKTGEFGVRRPSCARMHKAEPSSKIGARPATAPLPSRLGLGSRRALIGAATVRERLPDTWHHFHHSL